MGSVRHLRWVLPAALVGASFFVQASHAQEDRKELLEKLQRVALDPSNSYKVAEVRLRHDAIRLTLHHGTLVFFEPVAGRVTGAVFEGTGEVLVLPPDLPERQQMAKFTGSPILTETFDAAYFRFSDDTYAELRRQLLAGAGEPQHAPGLLERWAERLPALNANHSLRLVLDTTSSGGRYFYAGVMGERLGPFDLVVDERRPEQLLVGQLRIVEGLSYYDVWTSFSPRERPEAPPTTRARSYQIETTILPSTELEGVCEVELEPFADSRVLLFELSRRLLVQEVSEQAGSKWRPVEFFQNTAYTEEEVHNRGTDLVLVVLSEGSADAPRRLRFRYQGRVIAALGNGVYFVGARENWYPRLGSYVPARYELRFRFPATLELAATGLPRASRAEGEWKESVWVSETLLPVAGFNIGDYEARTATHQGIPIRVYANRQLEPPLLARALRPPAAMAPRRRGTPADEPPLPPLPQPPSVQAERVADDVGRALDFYSSLFGPFPYGELKVTQIPGQFGQGYPGLLYVSTLSFLAREDLARLGLNQRRQEHFLDLVPAHEVAHQWWGNWVQLPRYRDQWLAESLAAYSSLLYLEQQPGGQAVRQLWLSRYRDDLLSMDADGSPIDATGPLALGMRLNSSRSPDGYATLVYTKGPWVLHMLRELFRDSKTGSDNGFFSVLRGLAQPTQAPLTTDEFVRRLEAALPPQADVEGTGKLDWFFQQWVYNTGIPRYHLSWRARRDARRGWQVEGSIAQSEVSEVFTMPLPLFARFGQQLERLGTVVVTGKKVEFRFPVKAKPDEVLLDPYATVLAVKE
ncbi:MAG TPA: M1 family aminopeptidase [Candidatus Xenobia bacterium]|nr:M1 family aminopeptidase [Candidatus Xenobia bacterium]